MRVMLTQAKTEQLAVDAVQYAIANHKELVDALLPFKFELTRHAATHWYVIYANGAGLDNAFAGDTNSTTTNPVNELRNVLRQRLGYNRWCNRCNELVIDLSVWVCPKCGCNEWRLDK